MSFFNTKREATHRLHSSCTIRQQSNDLIYLLIYWHFCVSDLVLYQHIDNNLHRDTHKKQRNWAATKHHHHFEKLGLCPKCNAENNGQTKWKRIQWSKKKDRKNQTNRMDKNWIETAEKKKKNKKHLLKICYAANFYGLDRLPLLLRKNVFDERRAASARARRRAERMRSNHWA